MKKIYLWIMVVGLATALTAARAEGNHRFGVGANYWVALEDLDNDFDDNGLSYLITYQYRAGLLGFQIDAEYLADLYAEDAYAPAVYLVLGSAIYVAAGAGIYNFDDEWADDPFFALKAGLDLELLPNVHLDIGGSYRFESSVKFEDAIDDVDTDTVFLGVAVRLAL
jgi:hypothetical protein